MANLSILDSIASKTVQEAPGEPLKEKPILDIGQAPKVAQNGGESAFKLANLQKEYENIAQQRKELAKNREDTRTAVLKLRLGIDKTAPVEELLLLAVEALAKVTGEEDIHSSLKAKLVDVYGYGLKQGFFYEQAVKETMNRLKLLDNAYALEQDLGRRQQLLKCICECELEQEALKKAHKAENIMAEEYQYLQELSLLRQERAKVLLDKWRGDKLTAEAIEAKVVAHIGKRAEAKKYVDTDTWLSMGTCLDFDDEIQKDEK